MVDKKSGKFVIPKGSVFDDLTKRVKLIIRLMGDQRVNPLLKLLPIGALAYLLIPDLVLGPFDDAAVLWLGSYLFIELCPPEVVKEHTEALNRVISGQWQESPGDQDEVIDVGFHEE